jgi:hypothetical protein
LFLYCLLKAGGQFGFGFIYSKYGGFWAVLMVNGCEPEKYSFLGSRFGNLSFLRSFGCAQDDEE